MTPSDEGISGASAEKRPDFMKMIRHCKKGKINLIITKSISRFARNTLDSIGYVRKLMAMQEGKAFFQYAKCYAYQKGTDEQPEIIPAETEIIKRIYTRYLAGKSVPAIAKELAEDGIRSHAKSGEWTHSTIQDILKNERYCGDVLLQKTYISDPITKRVIVNNGQLPKILIKNNHPAIVSREIYDEVQQECARRVSKRKVSKVSKTDTADCMR